MSEGQAFRRSTAAKLVKRFPPLLDAIRNRQILISNLVLIRHVITTDNVHQLIASISGKSRREVEALVASLAPKPDVPASIRKTPVRSSKAAAASRPADAPPFASALAPCAATANSLASTLPFRPVPSGASGSERASSITVHLAAHATPAPDASRQFALGPVLARESTASLAPSSAAVVEPATGAGGVIANAPRSPAVVEPVTGTGGVAANSPRSPAIAEPATGTGAFTSNVSGRPSVSVARSIPVREQLTQLSEARHKVQFTVSTEQREKIERAQRLAKTTNFDGDIATLMEAAMDLLIAKLQKQKLATTSRARKSAGAARKVEASASELPATAAKGRADASFIPASVRREVLQRDGEQCAYVSPSGDRCGARELLELDHVRPRARGGPSDAANLRVFCQAHNHFAAEQIFGREYIERAIQRRRRQRRTSTAPPQENLTQTTLPLR